MSTLRCLLVLVVLVVEGDAVLLRQGGVLVFFVVGITRTFSEAEIEGPGTGLLQIARLFEAAMTTLIHSRAPTNTRELTLAPSIPVTPCLRALSAHRRHVPR